MREDNSFFKLSKLSSNLTLLTEEIPSVRSVALGFWVTVGSRFEPFEMSGYSHFLEHLLFKGTKKYSSLEISRIFDSLGAEVNAFTGKEYTCYYSRLLDQHVLQGLEVLWDMLINPLLQQSDIEQERQVVLEEIALYEDTPDENIHDFFISALFGDHPLGKSVLGNQKSLKKANSSKIKSFFQNHYTLPKTVLVTAGNINHQSLLNWFGQESKNEEVFNDTLQMVELAPQEESQVKIQTKETEQVHLCLGARIFHARHPDRFALAILDGLLGGGMSSRLFQEIREKRGLAYSVYSYHSLFIDTGLLATYVGTRPNNVKEVLKIVRGEFERLCNETLREEEVEKVKNQLKGRLILSMESTSARMNRLGKSYLAHGEILSLEQLINRVESVEIEDIHRIAQNYLTPDKISVTAIGPVKESDLS